MNTVRFLLMGMLLGFALGSAPLWAAISVYAGTACTTSGASARPSSRAPITPNASWWW